MKRGIIGVYHQLSVKHLGRYVQESAFRLNEGNVARKTVDELVLARLKTKASVQQLLIDAMKEKTSEQ